MFPVVCDSTSWNEKVYVWTFGTLVWTVRLVDDTDVKRKRFKNKGHEWLKERTFSV